jgi:hypothetical protein
MQMLNETAACAVEVGNLTATCIIPLEGAILGMGMSIGGMADDLVSVERDMLSFAEQQCGLPPPPQFERRGRMPRPPPAAPAAPAAPATSAASAAPAAPAAAPSAAAAAAVAAAATAGRVGVIAARALVLQQRSARALASVEDAAAAMPAAQRALLTGAGAGAEAGAGAGAGAGARAVAGSGSGAAALPISKSTTTPSTTALRFPNPLKWMDLMTKLLATMTSLSARMLASMAEVMVVAGARLLARTCPLTCSLTCALTCSLAPALPSLPPSLRWWPGWLA